MIPNKQLSPESNAAPPPKDLVDFRALLDWGILLWSFIVKRKWWPIGFVLASGVLAVIAVKVMPKTFEAGTQLLAKRNQNLSTKNENTFVGLTDGATEILHRRENLESMVKKTDLVNAYLERRAPIVKLKDDVMALVREPPEKEDIAEQLVGDLDKNLLVETENNTITISVQWSDAEKAYELVTAAQQSFLEERHLEEVSHLIEATAILEGRAAKQRNQIESAIAHLEKVITTRENEVRAQSKAKAEGNGQDDKEDPKPVARRRVVLDTPAQDDSAVRRLSELQVMIEEREKALSELTTETQRTVVGLQQQLEERRAVYTDAHPAIADLKRKLQVAQSESPQVSRLRGELHQLQAEQAALQRQTGTTPQRRVATASGVKDLNQRISAIEIPENLSPDDPEVQYARSGLNFAIRAYEENLWSIERARVDLDTAQAAFKYRYRVITPADIPRGPIKPKKVLVLLGAVLGGLMVGLFVAIALELKRDLIQESWQIERAVGLPVVANLELPKLNPPRPG